MLTITIILLIIEYICCYNLHSSYAYNFKFDTPDKIKKTMFEEDELDIKSGMDFRYPNETSYKQELEYEILEKNLKRLVLLRQLEDENKTNIEKINCIEKSDLFEKSYATSIYTAGLMDDFNIRF